MPTLVDTPAGNLRVHIVDYARCVVAEAIDGDASCARTSRRAFIENLSETSASSDS